MENVPNLNRTQMLLIDRMGTHFFLILVQFLLGHLQGLFRGATLLLLFCFLSCSIIVKTVVQNGLYAVQQLSFVCWIRASGRTLLGVHCQPTLTAFPSPDAYMHIYTGYSVHILVHSACIHLLSLIIHCLVLNWTWYRALL